ncbi:signal peptidase I [Kitasatospora sp. NPDC057936]|uniref:signal peptidase I n=1 Tax=Kitasatospora sp. NPDC057936 TaxID=3346283 RepID=UPI0036DE12E1
MNGESKPEEGTGSAHEPEAQERDAEQEQANEETESWWAVVSVAFSRAVVTLVTSLVLMPLAALVWGWSPSVVVSDSMRPALSRGDVVVTRSADLDEVGGGAVISFKDPLHDGRPTTHRAVERLEGGAAYRTKGDANPDPDPLLVRAEEFTGIVTVAVPWAGKAWTWAEDGDWGPLAVAVALYVLLLRGCWTGSRRSGDAVAAP